MMMHACFAYTHGIAQVLKAHPINPPTLHKVLCHVQESLSYVVPPNHSSAYHVVGRLSRVISGPRSVDQVVGNVTGILVKCVSVFPYRCRMTTDLYRGVCWYATAGAAEDQRRNLIALPLQLAPRK